MKKTVGSAVAIAILLVGCGSKTDPNEKNFGAAIAHYLDKRGEQCIGATTWPVEVNDFDVRLEQKMPGGRAGRMAALEAVGLVEGADVDKPTIGIMGKPMGGTYKVRSYALTDAAKPFRREVASNGLVLRGNPNQTRTDLCWGRKAFAEVIKWEGPLKLGDYQEATVQYRYKVEGLADWATKPEIAKAFPEIARVIDGASGQPAHHAVKLTSEGWEAKGLDNLF